MKDHSESKYISHKETTLIKMRLRINLDEDTLSKLIDGNFYLTIYKGVKAANDNMILSTVWCSIPAQELLEKNTLTWMNSYQAYISKGKVESTVRIEASTSRPIKIGDVFTFQDGKVAVDNGDNDDNDGVIEFVNEGSEYTTGISVSGINPMTSDKDYGPICAISMPGNSSMTIRPKEKLLVSFSTNPDERTAMCVEKIKTSAATVEYFDDIKTHEINYNFSSGVWAEGRNSINVTNGGSWFKFFKQGVHFLNKVLNG